MGATQAKASTFWTDPGMQKIRKTLAATTVIMGSSVVAMMLFGSEHGGNSVLGTASRTAKQVAYMIGDTNAVIAGVVLVLALLIGGVFWIRGK